MRTHALGSLWVGMRCHWSMLSVRSHDPCFAPVRSHLCQCLQCAYSEFNVMTCIAVLHCVVSMSIGPFFELAESKYDGPFGGEPGQIACMVFEEPVEIPGNQQMSLLQRRLAKRLSLLLSTAPRCDHRRVIGCYKHAWHTSSSSAAACIHHAFIVHRNTHMQAIWRSNVSHVTWHTPHDTKDRRTLSPHTPPPQSARPWPARGPAAGGTPGRP